MYSTEEKQQILQYKVLDGTRRTQKTFSDFNHFKPSARLHTIFETSAELHFNMHQVFKACSHLALHEHELYLINQRLVKRMNKLTL